MKQDLLFGADADLWYSKDRCLFMVMAKIAMACAVMAYIAVGVIVMTYIVMVSGLLCMRQGQVQGQRCHAEQRLQPATSAQGL